MTIAAWTTGIVSIAFASMFAVAQAAQAMAEIISPFSHLL